MGLGWDHETRRKLKRAGIWLAHLGIVSLLFAVAVRQGSEGPLPYFLSVGLLVATFLLLVAFAFSFGRLVEHVIGYGEAHSIAVPNYKLPYRVANGPLEKAVVLGGSALIAYGLSGQIHSWSVTDSLLAILIFVATLAGC